MMVRCPRWRDHRPSIETVHAITSLNHRQADPGLVASWMRSHWCIENQPPWVRDVPPGEDDSPIRTGAGPQVTATLRDTAINSPGWPATPTSPPPSGYSVTNPPPYTAS